MSFFNDAQRDGLLTGRYICSECGGLMEFEDEWEDMVGPFYANLNNTASNSNSNNGAALSYP